MEPTHLQDDMFQGKESREKESSARVGWRGGKKGKESRHWQEVYGAMLWENSVNVDGKCRNNGKYGHNAAEEQCSPSPWERVEGKSNSKVSGARPTLLGHHLLFLNDVLMKDCGSAHWQPVPNINDM